MVLLFVLVETVFLAVEHLNIHTTNIAFSLLILLPFFSLLADLSKLIDDDSAKHLLHDDLDDEKVHEMEEYLEDSAV